MQKKKLAKKAKSKVRKQPKIRKQSKPQTVEIVVRQESTVPTTEELAQPVHNGKELTIPKTWMNEHQLTFMLQKTPRQHVYKRPGKGGQKFDYVTVSYIQKALNFAFGWNWDFEIVEHGKEADHVWVMGKLTVRGMKPGQQIVKTQFGRSEVKKLKAGGNVDYGNDLKAAASDALKKCASLLGFASDIYGKSDYKAESGNEPLPPTIPPAYDKGENPAYEEPSVKQGEPSSEIVDYVCHWPGKGGCGADLTKAEAEFSKKMYGRELCRTHQKESKPR